ncbi:MAG: HD-GYP domain-containing protein [Deltaproteobacteria bacterium]|jgi:HD-GYP domain-containing protein (c-di-GMP phosphodiesterase class II)|nr:HD-GYP domain-containing protein [Deltaproteobacteria bacterium]
MQKKIPTNQLVPGMYTLKTDIHWRDNPYLYNAEGRVTSERIDKILSEGYLEVFIDPERTRPDFDNSAETVAASFGETVQDVEEEFEKPRTSLALEMDAAKNTYVEALEASINFMDNIRRRDAVDLYKGKKLVENLMGSLARNPDALLTLCKLRKADEYTYSHSVNVAVLALAFARHMSYPRSVQFEVGMSGLFHDLGKAMIPIEILNAPRDLSESELVILRRHPRLGYEYVKKTPGFTQEVLLGIYDHHERFDGSGYPRALKGDKISLAGRVISLVDVYDAISSRRPYKRAMLPHEVLRLMYQMRNTDFFPGFMEHFIRMLGIYPAGSVVEVSGGFIGVVTASNPSKPTKPKVLLVMDKQGTYIQAGEVDTGVEDAPYITRCLSEGESPIDPGKLLNINPDAPRTFNEQPPGSAGNHRR